jgi:hypothetical protein
MAVATIAMTFATLLEAFAARGMAPAAHAVTRATRGMTAAATGMTRAALGMALAARATRWRLTAIAVATRDTSSRLMTVTRAATSKRWGRRVMTSVPMRMRVAAGGMPRLALVMPKARLVVRRAHFAIFMTAPGLAKFVQ